LEEWGIVVADISRWGMGRRIQVAGPCLKMEAVVGLVPWWLSRMLVS